MLLCRYHGCQSTRERTKIPHPLDICGKSHVLHIEVTDTDSRKIWGLSHFYVTFQPVHSLAVKTIYNM